MKRCFKCRQKKLKSQFYKHPAMADGLLGKCKSCTKKDVRERYYDPTKTLQIREYERLRNQTAHRKNKRAQYLRTARKRYPGKNRARWKVRTALERGKLIRLPCKKCGAKAQAHHTDYRKPLEVIWLCTTHHKEIHKKL